MVKYTNREEALRTVFSKPKKEENATIKPTDYESANGVPENVVEDSTEEDKRWSWNPSVSSDEPEPEFTPVMNVEKSPSRPDEEEERKRRKNSSAAKPSWGTKIVDKVENFMDKTFIGKLYDEMR